MNKKMEIATFKIQTPLRNRDSIFVLNLLLEKEEKANLQSCLISQSRLRPTYSWSM